MGLELKPEVAEGTYSNLAVITHSSNEFVIDFAAMLPGFQKARVTSRVIMTPESARNLLHALSENLSKYEKMNGKIPVPIAPVGNGAKS